MTALTLDQMRYFVFCDHRDGEYSPERQTSDMDRNTTISDIAHGQIANVVRVIEWNAAEHVCSDVTDSILAEVDAQRDPEPRRRATQEQIWDHERDNRKYEAA